MNGAIRMQIKHWLRILLARIRGLLHQDAIAEEIREELHFHMDMRTEEYQRRGLSPEAAHSEAKRRVGNLALHQDRGYDVRGGGVVETILQDVRYTRCRWCRSPMVPPSRERTTPRWCAS